MTRKNIPLCSMVLISVLTGCASLDGTIDKTSSVSSTTVNTKGFLAPDARPASFTLIPPPPSDKTAIFEADKQIYLLTRQYRNTPRWEQAREDANLSLPEATGAFSCALGVLISPAQTPEIYKLMAESMEDADRSDDLPKKTYQRQRPFMYFDQQTCTPEHEAFLRKNGSYPSGHTTIGWTWALVLGQIAPDRSDEIYRRGYQFGQSRIVCGAHWASDVEAGRVIASTVFSKLQSNPTYLKQVEVAKAEIKRLQADGIKQAKDCSIEMQRLNTPGPMIP